MKVGNIADWRHITNGREIPVLSYADQPFVVQTDDNAWLCCVTTGTGIEGEPGQQVITMRSKDQGKTWSKPVALESNTLVENSYAVMQKVPSGRIYIFYNHNTDNVREVHRHDGKAPLTRVDSLGHFVFKYSDDHGKTWSEKRHDIPFRLFACDRDNVYNGKICFFWNVGKPFAHKGSVFLSLHKVGKMGQGFFAQSEGALLKSSNLLTEENPEKITWETLPDGDYGLRTPEGGGPVAEEQSYVVLSDGSFHAVYRSIDGYPVEAYSRDGGHTWSEPAYMCYASGRKIKNPRAANFHWKCSNGKYVYWHHNHGGHFIREYWNLESDTNGLVRGGGSPYDDRNPVWLCGGVEADSPEGKILLWSEPDIVIYDDDPFIRMSYPDFIEENGKYYLTETQKNKARLHEIPTDFLESLWAGLERSIELDVSKCINTPSPIAHTSNNTDFDAPQLPTLFERDHTALEDLRGKRQATAFSIELELLSSEENMTLLNGQRSDGRGIVLRQKNNCLELELFDGWQRQLVISEPCIIPGKNQHIVLSVDGRPAIVSFIVDGKFCDGGEHQQFGWGRISPYFRHINWTSNWKLSSEVQSIKVYDTLVSTADTVLKYYEKTC